MATSLNPVSDTYNAVAQELGSAPPERLLSLDVFRGLTVAGMILVNDPGSWSSIYWPLEHAAWNGWTPTDLVFPFFLFIVGVSMAFSLGKKQLNGAARERIFWHIVRRAAIIFAIGLFLNGYPYFHIHRIRYLGVLQRIAICYLYAGACYMWTSRRGRILTVVALLAGYWLLMTQVTLPYYGKGHLDPEGNFAAFVDRYWLMQHMWKPMWDPEGIVSSLPAIASVLLGTFVGEWLRSPATPARKLQRLLIAGVCGLLIGEVMNVWFPINKNLWTSSFTVFTAGFASLLLAVCYWLVEIKNWRRWAKPFVVFGTNPLAAFFISMFLARNLGIWTIQNSAGASVNLWHYVFSTLFLPVATPINASLLFGLAYVGFCLLLVWLLYRRKIFIRI